VNPWPSPQSATFADDQRTREHFEALSQQHGGDVRALDWGSREAQERRFAVLASIGDLHGARVLDVGCGHADFYAWLCAQGVQCEYSGVDLSPTMIRHCLARFPERPFAVCNLLEQNPPLASYDYVFASGIFYLRRDSPDAYLCAMIERMFALCSRGLGFNSLSSWGASQQQTGEFRADPVATLAQAAQLSGAITLCHDYHPGDFTLLLHKSPPA
jgi:SAM-dependent methyltransferase